MNSVSELQAALATQVHDAKRQLTGTVILGLMAAFLAFVGQSALTQARPIFPMVDMAYSSWQSGYNFVLWLLALAWLAALVKQSVQFQELRERYESQKQMDLLYAQRAEERRLAAEERGRQAAAAAAAEAALPKKKFDKNARSRKFDY
ncbi:hypothetical protein ACHMW6_28295 [Pseudoduganella sp. UC29_106]|uniref:hypothetical protein n=1 Tax=Pseudoduganella sp. UC29_106 TaxID=3374553 RepID=UPI003757B504